MPELARQIHLFDHQRLDREKPNDHRHRLTRARRWTPHGRRVGVDHDDDRVVGGWGKARDDFACRVFERGGRDVDLTSKGDEWVLRFENNQRAAEAAHSSLDYLERLGGLCRARCIDRCQDENGRDRSSHISF
jgi:hypothetical protein